MPKIEPISDITLKKLLGSALFGEWQSLIKLITTAYEMDQEWHSAAKGEKYELKFRRGGKTLVSLFPTYPKEDGIGVMIIFGKQERENLKHKKPLSQRLLTVIIQMLQPSMMGSGLCLRHLRMN